MTSTSAEGPKLHENLAPVLVIISGKSLVFPKKNYCQYWFLPVLRPRRVSTSSGKKSVSHHRKKVLGIRPGKKLGTR